METDDFLKKLKNTYSNSENTEPEERVEGKIPHRPFGQGKIRRGRNFNDLSTQEKLIITYRK
jgi:hypothetical protein